MAIVNWEIYIAHGDKPCAICEPLDHQVYRQGEGPQPQMHPHCQCERLPYATEYTFDDAQRERISNAYGIDPSFVPPSVFITKG